MIRGFGERICFPPNRDEGANACLRIKSEASVSDRMTHREQSEHQRGEAPMEVASALARANLGDYDGI
jgi:hypothetical protein